MPLENNYSHLGERDDNGILNYDYKMTIPIPKTNMCAYMSYELNFTCVTKREYKYSKLICNFEHCITLGTNLFIVNCR